jgi:hypothetical protein
MKPMRRNDDTRIGMYWILGDESPKRKKTTAVTCECYFVKDLRARESIQV